jgi:hypothetical protein
MYLNCPPPGEHQFHQVVPYRVFCARSPWRDEPRGTRGARIGYWPILLKLERAGKLTFHDDDIRERFQRMKPRG